MTSTAVVLALIGDPELAAAVDRVAAAAGVRMLTGQPANRRNWRAAAAVVVDADAALRCAQAGLPRRDGVIVVVAAEPTPAVWSAAVAVGARHLVVLSAQDAELVRMLVEAADTGDAPDRLGRVVAVVGGRGGSGASVFAAALSQCAGEALLADLDPYGGGIDLLMGAESAPGLRWTDFGAQAGRLNWPAVRDALPSRGSVSILSGPRDHHDIDPAALAVIVESGQRSGTTVVCDVARQLNSAGAAAVERADLVVVVTSCDIRGIAGAAAVAGVLRTLNANVGMVLRGPAPGGLAPGDAAELAAVPLLAAMRPEPSLAQRLEQGGLRLGRRSPLAVAARRVLGLLGPAAP